jgi:hypothetical protein
VWSASWRMRSCVTVVDSAEAREELGLLRALAFVKLGDTSQARALLLEAPSGGGDSNAALRATIADRLGTLARS